MQCKAEGFVPDMGFDPEFPVALDDRLRVSTWRAHHLLAPDPQAQCTLPNGQVLIVGGDEVSYGRAPKNARSWREAMLREVNIDTSSETGRVHFLGKLPYAQYRRVLQVSAVHVYLTYPFVLSWSLLEAMASGCAVIASDTAPVREVIRHGENGWLVDFFDGKQIVEAVRKVLAEPDGMQAMRRAAVESVKERFAQATGATGYLEGLGLQAGPTTMAKPVNEISVEET